MENGGFILMTQHGSKMRRRNGREDDAHQYVLLGDAVSVVSFPFRRASWTRRVVALAPERYDDDDVSVSLSFVFSFVLLVR